ncbi:MAG: ATP-binding protein [Acidobacteriota bacterium]
MARTNRILTSRRLVLASTVFVLFVLFDIALFGWLIFDALSQREIEEVLLETRQQAEPIAEGLAAHAEAQGSEDLFVVVSVAQESRTYIESVLSQRELVRSIEIRDRDGMVVYQEQNRDELPLDGTVPRMDDAGRPEQPLLETTVPIGDLGTLVVGLSREEVQRRVQTLRGDLVRHASLVGAFTTILLIAGGIAFIQLFRRARRIEDQAVERERLAYVGTLASGLAHEIRSPLNSLSLNMQMLEEEARELEGSASQQRLLQITRSELRRLEGLATDFLAYAKPQPVERRKVALIELLRRVREVLAAEIRERGVEIDVEDRTRGHEVSVDPAQFGQLLLNLCQNALAAVETVRRERLVRLVARFDHDDPVLEVIDNGEGIPDRVRMKMFDLFYSNRKGGTGLGLAIVQRIAESHDAKIEVDTVPGSGTTVRIRFPRQATT